LYNNDEMEAYLRDFSKEYGETIGLKANIAAINMMLLKRDRGQELFDNIKTVVNKYKNTIKDTNV